MSQATAISKKVGWEPQPMAFPLKSVAEALRAKVEKGDVDAYEAITRYNRFLPTAVTAEERDIQGIIWDALWIGNKMHQ